VSSSLRENLQSDRVRIVMGDLNQFPPRFRRILVTSTIIFNLFGAGIIIFLILAHSVYKM